MQSGERTLFSESERESTLATVPALTSGKSKHKHTLVDGEMGAFLTSSAVDLGDPGLVPLWSPGCALKNAYYVDGIVSPGRWSLHP